MRAFYGMLRERKAMLGQRAARAPGQAAGEVAMERTGAVRPTATVIRLAAWQRPARPGHPALALLRAHWEAAREAGRPPLRQSIDPRRIGPALEHAFVAERIAPGVARLRIAGRQLADLLGMEVRGMPLTVFFTPAARDLAAAEIERAFATGLPVSLRLASPAEPGRPTLAGEMLLLPLRDGTGAVARLLGGIAVAGGIGRSPRRFAIDGAAEAAAADPCPPPVPAPGGRHLRLVPPAG